MTRPEHDAARTARELEVRGHTVVLAPLMRIETIDADLDGEWGAVLMTSANAAHALAAHRHAAMLRDRPVFTVGDRTADAAREAGFTEVASADGALADLARLVSERCAGGRTLLLYAAGEDRAGDLSSTLGAHGIAVRTIAVYRAHAQKTLPATVRICFVAATSTAFCIIRVAVLRLFSAFPSRPCCLTRRLASCIIACRPKSLRHLRERAPDGSRSQPRQTKRRCLGFSARRERHVAAAPQPQYVVEVAARFGDAAMADGKQDPVVPPPRKRPAPTIDLKATEVVSDPVTSAQATDSPADTAKSEPKLAGTSEAPPRAAAQSAAPILSWPVLAAGGAGVAATLCIVGLFWLLGGQTQDDNTPALNARLATVEQQIRDLAARPQPAAADPRALAELAASVSKLETIAAAPRPAAADPALALRVAALETALRPLADLAPRVDAIAAAQKNMPPSPPATDQADVAALTARITALEQAEKAIEQRVARPATGGADQAGRAAFVAVALRAAVERGDPFAQELSAAKALASDAAMLAPLEPFAATGVPRSAALARELSQVTTPMLNAAGPARESGILDRLQQNAERLVRIRPINEGAGDEPSAVVARAEVKAAHGDIAGALVEVARLPDAMRAPAQAWIRKAEMQIAALAAARRFAETAVDALAKAGQ